MRALRFIVPAAAALALGACYDTVDNQAAPAADAGVPASVTLPAAPPAITASSFPEGQAIDVAMSDCLFSLLYDEPIDCYERLDLAPRQGNRKHRPRASRRSRRGSPANRPAGNRRRWSGVWLLS